MDTRSLYLKWPPERHIPCPLCLLTLLLHGLDNAAMPGGQMAQFFRNTEALIAKIEIWYQNISDKIVLTY